MYRSRQRVNAPPHLEDVVAGRCTSKDVRAAPVFVARLVGGDDVCEITRDACVACSFRRGDGWNYVITV